MLYGVYTNKRFMIKFIINVPSYDEPNGNRNCNLCPWYTNIDVCTYCSENELCLKYDFSKTHIEEYNEEN